MTFKLLVATAKKLILYIIKLSWIMLVSLSEIIILVNKAGMFLKEYSTVKHH